VENGKSWVGRPGLGDLLGLLPLRQSELRGHHRPAAPADDPHQAPALVVVVDLPHPQAFGHRPSLGDQHSQEKLPSRASTGTTDLRRHEPEFPGYLLVIFAQRWRFPVYP
jgi:hypothetical protein